MEKVRNDLLEHTYDQAVLGHPNHRQIDVLLMEKEALWQRDSEGALTAVLHRLPVRPSVHIVFRFCVAAMVGSDRNLKLKEVLDRQSVP